MAGQDASWVDVDTALLASDDPDYGSTATRKPPLVQELRLLGARGGPRPSPTSTTRLVTAYNAGDYPEASRHLGRCRTTTPTSVSRITRRAGLRCPINSRHFPYELKVSELNSSYGDHASWVRTVARRAVNDVRERRRRCRAVRSDQVRRHRLVVQERQPRVRNLRLRPTGYVLNRGVNDLTDIIRAVAAGRGSGEAACAHEAADAEDDLLLPAQRAQHRAT